jgi:hypothetical protein
MSTRRARGRYALAALAASLACAAGAVLSPTATASSGGASTVCNAVGAPSTTQTVGVKGVFHVTVFTCGDAQAPGFQQCANQTVAVPGVVHTRVYYCLPLQIGVGLGPTGQTAVIGGVGGVGVGTG